MQIFFFLFVFKESSDCEKWKKKVKVNKCSIYNVYGGSKDSILKKKKWYGKALKISTRAWIVKYDSDRILLCLSPFPIKRHDPFPSLHRKHLTATKSPPHFFNIFARAESYAAKAARSERGDTETYNHTKHSLIRGSFPHFSSPR